jgi:hypothetical protein
VRYLDSDTLAEARNALRAGVPLTDLAGRLDVQPADLRWALGLPAVEDADGTAPDSSVDLWAEDRANAAL